MEAGFVALLDSLPQALLDLCLEHMRASDKKSLRAVNKTAQGLVNSVVTGVKLPACHLPGNTMAHVLKQFPQIQQLQLVDSKGSAVRDDALAVFIEADAASPGAAAWPHLAVVSVSVRDSHLALDNLNHKSNPYAWGSAAVSAPTAPATRQTQPRTKAAAQITSLNLKRCHFLTQSSVQLLAAALPNLTTVLLSCWATATSVAALQPLQHLHHLDLGDEATDVLSIDDTAMQAVALLPGLVSLKLQHCIQVTDLGLFQLACLPHLETLDIRNMRVSGMGLLGLVGSSSLTALDASECRNFDDSGLTSVSKVASVRQLVIPGTSITPAGLAQLPQLPDLQVLDLGSSFEVNDAGISALAGCSALRTLNVGNFNLHQAPPEGNLPALQHLAFGGLFYNRGLNLLLPLPALTSMQLSGIDAVTDVSMSHVAKQGGLASLELSGGYHLTVKGLSQLSGARSLRVLRLSACPKVTEWEVRELLGSCQGSGGGLREIQMRGSMSGAAVTVAV